MTLRIEPLESCMNVLNVFSLKCFILSIYILCCLFIILSRGLTIIKIFCVYYRPVLTNGLMSDRLNFNVKIKVAVILWLLIYTVCYFILSSFNHFSDPKYPVSLIIFITNQLRLKKNTFSHNSSFSINILKCRPNTWNGKDANFTLRQL